MFRTLRADEIECRVSRVTAKGVAILLYKDARADQNLLDETVGPFNWKREHQTIDGRLYCTVSIYDEAKDQWVSKQDVGTESYTEKEKGQASDSFKRACFNWGIGRELYTAPFIWFNASDCNIKEGADNNGKKKYTTYDRFEVLDIKYHNKQVVELVVKNTKTGSLYRWKDNKVAEDTIDGAKVKVIEEKIKKTGTEKKALLTHYGVESLDELTISNFTSAMNTLNKKDEVK